MTLGVGGWLHVDHDIDADVDHHPLAGDLHTGRRVRKQISGRGASAPATDPHPPERAIEAREEMRGTSCYVPVSMRKKSEDKTRNQGGCVDEKLAPKYFKIEEDSASIVKKDPTKSELIESKFESFGIKIKIDECADEGMHNKFFSGLKDFSYSEENKEIFKPLSGKNVVIKFHEEEDQKNKIRYSADKNKLTILLAPEWKEDKEAKEVADKLVKLFGQGVNFAERRKEEPKLLEDMKTSLSRLMKMIDEENDTKPSMRAICDYLKTQYPAHAANKEKFDALLKNAKKEVGWEAHFAEKSSPPPSPKFSFSSIFSFTRSSFSSSGSSRSSGSISSFIPKLPQFKLYLSFFLKKKSPPPRL